MFEIARKEEVNYSFSLVNKKEEGCNLTIIFVCPYRLLANMEEKYAKVIDYANDENVALRQSEKIFFITSHCDMGAYLIGLWELPCDICRGLSLLI